MRNSFLFFLLFLGLSFPLYQFDVSIAPVENVSIRENYSASEPDLLFYFNNTLYVADRGTPALFSYNGSELKKLMESQLSSASGVYAAQNGTIYVSDRDVGILRYYPSRTIYSGSGANGIALYNETFYISDYYNDRIRIIALDGEELDVFGAYGTYNSYFINPEDVQFFNDSLYVADSGNGRVERFTSSMQYVQTYGNGKAGVILRKPVGILVTDDYIYVADSLGDQIAIYTHDGYPIYVYSISSPEDIAMNGNKVYISQSELEGNIFIANISISTPSEYAGAALDSLDSQFSAYSSYSDLCVLLNISHNRTIATEWSNAKFAFANNNYGEAFYKALELNETNISAANGELESSLYAKIAELAKTSSAKSEIISMLDEGKYSAAYSKLITSPQEERNITENITQENGSWNLSTKDYLALQGRLQQAKRLIKDYKLDISVSEIEGALPYARTNKSAYDSAIIMFQALESRMNLQIYKIHTAQQKISALEGEIAKNEFLVDYSAGVSYLKNATLLVYSDPERAAGIAEDGIAYVQKERDSKILVYFVIISFVALAIVLLIFKSSLVPPRPPHRYHFRK